jgi:superfamily I DNA and/or RNA helicase
LTTATESSRTTRPRRICLPLQTVDSFQGKEGTLAFVILGTKSGQDAGFVTNDFRLNVMITRQKSGLIIVGDKLVTDKLSGGSKEMAKINTIAKKGTVS